MNIDEHYDKVFRFCYWKVHNKEIAEDITQETFLRYFKSNYQEKGKELNYLYTIARNLCIDEYSKSKIEFTIDGELSDDGTSIAEMEKEVLSRLTLSFYLLLHIINVQNNLYWAGRKTRVHHSAGKTPAVFYSNNYEIIRNSLGMHWKNCISGRKQITVWCTE